MVAASGLQRASHRRVERWEPVRRRGEESGFGSRAWGVGGIEASQFASHLHFSSGLKPLNAHTYLSPNEVAIVTFYKCVVLRCREEEKKRGKCIPKIEKCIYAQIISQNFQVLMRELCLFSYCVSGDSTCATAHR